MNISLSIVTGKGVPDKRIEETKKTFILPSIDMLPTGEEAVSAYERDGGNLGSPEVFGTDILAGNEQLQQLRFDNFNAAYNQWSVPAIRPFSSFFVWSFWADSCQIKAGIPIFSPLN